VHPRSDFAVPSARQRHLLGDETALPAIGGILELPTHMRADVFVAI
jgi:NADPH-dependent ferric siderophore reductase